MLYCEQCKTEISGTYKKCPLCGCRLDGEPDEELTQYPVIVSKKHFIDRIPGMIKFISIVSCVICVLINYLTYKETMWSGLVIAGAACGWLIIEIGVPMRANLIKMLQWELYIMSVLAVGWDYFTGWHAWSVAFVIPCAAMACMAVMALLVFLLRKEIKDYFTYMALVDILGFVSVLFLFMDSVKIKVPSALCVGVSVLFLITIFFFKRKAAYGEIKKKLHM